jgi:protein-disulfide isomerase
MKERDLSLNKKDHLQGNRDAPVVLVEYGDYECPYCAKAHKIVIELQRVFRSKLAFVYRHYPLINIHAKAQQAAIAAEAAGMFGKFWEMHSLLFENQHYLNRENLLKLADRIGLKVTDFDIKMKDINCIDKVKSDLSDGKKLCVQRTPTFFINNEYYEGRWNFLSLKRVIEEILRINYK